MTTTENITRVKRYSLKNTNVRLQRKLKVEWTIQTVHYSRELHRERISNSLNLLYTQTESIRLCSSSAVKSDKQVTYEGNTERNS